MVLRGVDTDKKWRLSEAEVNVAYAKPDDQVYVSLSATAHLVDDRAKARNCGVRSTKRGFRRGWTTPTCG